MRRHPMASDERPGMASVPLLVGMILSLPLWFGIVAVVRAVWP